MITFTLDLENHRSDSKILYVEPTLKLLTLLSNHLIKATVFVEGQIINEARSLIRQIASMGHEIGYHWERTEYLKNVNPAHFSDVASRRRKEIEDLIGTECRGFRAPIFSVPLEPLKNSTWLPKALVESGFRYSSSIVLSHKLEKKLSQGGKDIFIWDCGLIEFPVPTLSDALRIPFLGGIYFRYLPYPLIERRLRQIKARQSPSNIWAYFHPYDFDSNEGFVQFPRRGLLSSCLLSFNRSNTLQKLTRLIANNSFDVPFGEKLDTISIPHLRTWSELNAH